MVVGYGVGGPSDTIARIIAERMKPALGQPIVVENITGAAGSIGMGRLARAMSDGYTIGLGDWSTLCVNAAMYTLPYDVVKDFAPDFPLAERAADHRHKKCRSGERPHGAARVAQGEPKTRYHMALRRHWQPVARQRRPAAERHRRQLPARALPRRGAGHDRHGCRPDRPVDAPSNRGARSKCARVTPGPMRSRARPGFPRRQKSRRWTRQACQASTSRYGGRLWAPKGTPNDIIAKLNAAIVEALADPAVRARTGRPRPRYLPHETSRRRRRSPPFRRPRSRNGGRSSRRRASKASDPATVLPQILYYYEFRATMSRFGSFASLRRAVRLRRCPLCLQ